MLKALPGFKTSPTDHCVTGSLRHIYEFQGHSISEDMLLGLGEGIGFVYWHMKGTIPFIGGRANIGRAKEEGLEVTAGKRTGVKAQSHKTTSSTKAEKQLFEILDAGQPVMVRVDMGFMPYLGLPEDYHFGGHVVVVAGYDPQTHSCLVADRDDQLYEMELAQLAKARGSKFKPFPPRHEWHTFDFSQFHEPGPDEIKKAISQVVKNMLKPPITNLGVEGIRKTAKRISDWPKVLDDEQMQYTCFNAFIFIDARGGTGGGLFRYMYGRFLDEAAKIVGDNQLKILGEQLHSIGDQWQGAAALFEQASQTQKPAGQLSEVIAKLNYIADLEQEFWQSLGDCVKS